MGVSEPVLFAGLSDGNTRAPLTREEQEDRGARVALTTDIGEGLGRWSLGDDDALLEIVTSANIACGFHGGDPGIMRRTCAISVKNNVAIGAQVSYRDLHGFGRRHRDPGAELRDDLLYQMGALRGLRAVGGWQGRFRASPRALWNVATKDTEHAQASSMRPSNSAVIFPFWRPGRGHRGVATRQEAGLRMVAEAFVDRAYTPRRAAAVRGEANALLTDADAAAAGRADGHRRTISPPMTARGRDHRGSSSCALRYARRCRHCPQDPRCARGCGVELFPIK